VIKGLKRDEILRRKGVTLATVVTPEVGKVVRQLVSVMGISVSEYIRHLILKDLDEKMLFTRQLKDSASGSKYI